MHATALATVVALTWTNFVPLLVLGEPPLLAVMDNLAEEDSEDASDAAALVARLDRGDG